MAFTRFNNLTEPWWSRQPDESPNAYQRFTQYRDQPRGERSLAKLANSLARDPRTIQQQAQAQRWEERAAAWDADQTQQHYERVAKRAEMLAEDEIAAARELLHLVRMSAKDRIATGDLLDPDDMARWADTAAKLGQAATKSPEHTRAVYRSSEARTRNDDGSTTSNGWEIEIPGMAGLPADQQRQRLNELIGSMERLSRYEDRETHHNQHNQ